MKVIKESDSQAVEIACQFLKEGKLIVFATDTIYGVAADASNEKAVATLYQLKERELNKPIAIFLKNIHIAKKLFIFDDLLEKVAKKHLPGPLTIVAELRDDPSTPLAKNLNPNNNSLGFRIVDRTFINHLLEEFNGVLAVTSANISGQNVAQNLADIQKYFCQENKDPKLDLMIDSGDSKANGASTVVKISNNKMEILRHGFISEAKLLNS
jgi:L-threonylcarbamoyladenylate synthase